MTTTTIRETARRIDEYFTALGATTTYDGTTIQADFAGDLATVKDRMRRALDLAAGRHQDVKEAFYQDLANAMDMHDDYRRGVEVTWQNAEMIYGMPVIISFHRSEHRPDALPHELVSGIAYSADLILPGIGPVMRGHETAPNGRRRAHLTVSPAGIDTFINAN